ncbi:hypothetical protein EPD60_11795 [Flaviaesturariibacter flavus]|uniref:Uncharacterized protein n=1 Tax=Flaviaesturariibacter flavus TaxID=2502780 RepID=A0A4R1BA06_9BACT|nr:hypothetical protein [Flaviaesturariibacter flavus]TCJ13770.1 hypothetical protein EPD60_11795 [Flaviaesturariibacter flavus]
MKPSFLLFVFLINSGTAGAQEPIVLMNYSAQRAFFDDFQKRTHEPGFHFADSGPLEGDSSTDAKASIDAILEDPWLRKTYSAGDAVFLSRHIRRQKGNRYHMDFSLSVVDSVSGREVEMQLETANRRPAQPLYGRLRFPLTLRAAPTSMEETQVNDSIRLPKIAAGSQLTWNPDTGNRKGVFISVYFSLRNKPNIESWGHGGFRERTNCMRADDTGGISLPKALFEGIPGGSIVIITILRGNWSDLYQRDGSYSPIHFSAWTIRDGLFVFSY